VQIPFNFSISYALCFGGNWARATRRRGGGGGGEEEVWIGVSTSLGRTIVSEFIIKHMFYYFR